MKRPGIQSLIPLIKFILIPLFFFIITCDLKAQLTVIQGKNMGLTPEQLIRDHLIGKGLVISNVTLNGSSDTIQSPSIGYFHTEGGASAQLNMKDGIVMTSGFAEYSIGPNNKPDKGTRLNTGGDPDLDILSGTTTLDACVIEFDFVPQCDTLEFRYAFGSEEFYEFCSHSVNDAFGFFLSGPGISGEFSNNSINIALMPGSSDFVNIDNVCPDSSSAWNNNNGVFFQYDAITYVFTARYIIVPYQTYHLKLAISDAGDRLYDSGVFLEEGSFSAGFDFNIENLPSSTGKGQNAIEGCNDIIVSFILPQPAQGELMIEFSAGGTAVSGTDYQAIPSSVTFQQGQDSAAIIIHPLMDGIPEGTESVILNILKRNCKDTVEINDTIFILDNSAMTVSAGNDQTLCPGDTARIDAITTGGVGPFTYVWEDSPSHDSFLLIYPPLETHSYKVTVTDCCGAMGTDSLTIYVDTIAVLANQPAEKTICSGESTMILLTSNITYPSFSWTPVLISGEASGYYGGTGNSIDQVLVVPGQTPAIINYQVQVTGNSCDTTWNDFPVMVNPTPWLNLGGPVFMEQGTSVRLHAGGGYVQYLWSTGSTDSVITVDQPGIYSVMIKNEYGCSNYDSISVNELGLYIPNAFTPNGDGLNDIFRIKGFEQEENVILQIFDRWGRMVFDTNSPAEGWDGTCNGQPCPPGTYAWIIWHGQGSKSVFKGTVTLVK